MADKQTTREDDCHFHSDQSDENAGYNPDNVDTNPRVKADDQPSDQLSNAIYETHETRTVNTEQSTHDASASKDVARKEETSEEIVWIDTYSYQHMPHETEYHVPSAGPPSYTGYYVVGPGNDHAAPTTNSTSLKAGYGSMGGSYHDWNTIDVDFYDEPCVDGSEAGLERYDLATASSYLDAQHHTPVYPAGGTLLPPSPLGTIDALPRPAAAYLGYSPEEPTGAIPTTTYTPDPATQLLYHSAAAASAAQNNRPLHWPIRTTHDPSFPRTPRSRAHYVHCLVSAMKDVSVASDNRANPVFRKRWLDPISRGEYAYSAEAFELACWSLVETVERLHTHGLACFSIYDSATLDKAAREAELTFGERIGVMCEYLRFKKGKVDSLMRGDGVETFVAVTGGKLRENKVNRGKKAAAAVGLVAQMEQQQKQQQKQQQPVQKVVECVELPRPSGVVDPGHTTHVSFQQQLFQGWLPLWQPGSYPGMVSHEPVQQDTGTAESWGPIVAGSAAEPSHKRSLGTVQFQDDEEGTARGAKRAK